MNLDELRTVQSKERRKDSLQHLRDSFYEDVAAYIQDLQATRDRRAEQVKNPFSDDEIRRLSDELETAEEVAEAVYERRVGKVVKLASFSAADMPVDDEGMTSEERALFDDLVSRIKQNKHTVLEILTGGATPASADTASSSADETEPVEAASTASAVNAVNAANTDNSPVDAEPAEPTGVLAEAMGATDDETESASDQAEPEPSPSPTPDQQSAEQPTSAPSATPTDVSETAEATSVDNASTEQADDRTTVRITKDVGEIFGVDEREYTLRREDVVTLPSANAEPLLKQNAATRLD